jgi:dUTP pyrophosphatase
MSGITVKIKLLNTNTIIPSYATEGSAGLDLHANFEDRGRDIITYEGSQGFWLHPRESRLVSCGFSLEMPVGYEAQIRPRSGLALNHGITVLNSPGTIDETYRGPVKVLLVNHNRNTSFFVKDGMRIAQMVIQKVPHVSLIEVDELNNTERGAGGFGSTGV